MDIESKLKTMNNLVYCSGHVAVKPPQVRYAFSDMIVEIFGENGKHARSAVGTNALPGNIAVEIEMIVEISN